MDPAVGVTEILVFPYLERKIRKKIGALKKTCGTSAAVVVGVAGCSQLMVNTRLSS